MKLKGVNNRLFHYIFFIIILMGVASCRQIDVFEKNVPIPDANWFTSNPVTGSFIITDTVSAYNIYVILRHNDAYVYNNIWLKAGLQSPGDTMYSNRLNLVLGSDASGWEGTGMDNIWEVRKLLTPQPRRFKKAGTYQFSIAQIMRDNPLPNIMSAGMRLEKVAD